jgi:hypothetical protein
MSKRPTYYILNMNNSKPKGKTSAGEDVLGIIGILLMVLISIPVILIIPTNCFISPRSATGIKTCTMVIMGIIIAIISFLYYVFKD